MECYKATKKTKLLRCWSTFYNLRIKYTRNNDLYTSNVIRSNKNFRGTGSISDFKHSGRPSTTYSAQNIDTVEMRVVLRVHEH